MNAQTIALAPSYPLITRERTEKLDLLNHLIANLAHAIIVCGPQGVGKTRMLKSFQEASADSWIFCQVQGGSHLCLEKIQELLGASISQNIPDSTFKHLINAFDRLAGRDAKVILVIDDAGNLAPGVIENIISYANDKPVLSVVFALTHSELYLKNSTDPAIDDCYQIEIPPLSEKQCGEFLEYLSTLPRPRIQFSAINESMITALYHETHGIPGRILAQLPKDNNHKKTDYATTILMFAVIGLISVALGAQWWSSRPKIDSDKATTAENKQKSDADIQRTLVKPTVSAQVKQSESVSQLAENTLSKDISNPTGALVVSKLAGIRNDVIDSPGQLANDQYLMHDDTKLQSPGAVLSAEKPAQSPINDGSQLAEKVAPSGQVQTEAIPLDEGGQWVMGQPVENVTLQLMALSNEQALIEVMQRHQALGQNLRVLKTKTRRGKDRFVLLYGSFSSPEQAKREGGMLPKELQKNWVRKIGAVQKELGIPTQTDTPE
jgi:DamX protein